MLEIFALLSYFGVVCLAIRGLFRHVRRRMTGHQYDQTAIFDGLPPHKSSRIFRRRRKR